MEDYYLKSNVVYQPDGNLQITDHSICNSIKRTEGKNALV